MFQQKFNLYFRIVPSVLMFLNIFLGQCLSSSKDNGGITYFDNMQNSKIKDRTIIRNNVYLIKVDCGNICNTSYDSELTIHKGKIKLRSSKDLTNKILIGRSMNNTLIICFKSTIIFKVTKGKYVPKMVKEYDCQELFQSPLFDQPSKLLNPNGRW